MTETAAGLVPPGHTIDEVALMAGMTVRTVRAHQASGLLPPPALRGRTGYYGDEHLDRLRLIRDMQQSGFNLRAIAQILQALPSGVAADVLGIERSLRTAWTEEAHEIVSVSQLAGRFPGLEDLSELVHAQDIGTLRDLGDGRVEVCSPSLLRVGETLWRLGIPLAATHRVQAELSTHATAVAQSFVRLFLTEVWQPFVAAGKPESDWPRIRRTLDELRPLALEGLMSTFRVAMSRAVVAAFDEVVEEQAGVPARDPARAG